MTDEGLLRMWWATGTVHDGDHDRPLLERVAEVVVPRAPVAGEALSR